MNLLTYFYVGFLFKGSIYTLGNRRTVTDLRHNECYSLTNFNQHEYYDNNNKLINGFIKNDKTYYVIYNGMRIGNVTSPCEKAYLNILKLKLFE